MQEAEMNHYAPLTPARTISIRLGQGDFINAEIDHRQAVSLLNDRLDCYLPETDTRRLRSLLRQIKLQYGNAAPGGTLHHNWQEPIRFWFADETPEELDEYDRLDDIDRIEEQLEFCREHPVRTHCELDWKGPGRRKPIIISPRHYAMGYDREEVTEIQEGNVVRTLHDIRGVFHEVTDLPIEVVKLLVLLKSLQAALVGGNDPLGLFGMGGNRPQLKKC